MVCLLMPKPKTTCPSKQEVGEQRAASRKVRVTLTTRWLNKDGAKRCDENRQSVSFDTLSASGLGAGSHQTPSQPIGPRQLQD